MIDSGFIGMGFQQLFAFSGFMGMVFCKNLFISELFWHFQIYGYDVQNILLLRNFSRFIGGIFTI